jgi:hypothetical protein
MLHRAKCTAVNEPCINKLNLACRVAASGFRPWGLFLHPVQKTPGHTSVTTYTVTTLPSREYDKSESGGTRRLTPAMYVNHLTYLKSDDDLLER